MNGPQAQAIGQADPRLVMWLSIPECVRWRIVAVTGCGWRHLPLTVLARCASEAADRGMSS